MKYETVQAAVEAVLEEATWEMQEDWTKSYAGPLNDLVTRNHHPVLKTAANGATYYELPVRVEPGYPVNSGDYGINRDGRVEILKFYDQRTYSVLEVDNNLYYKSRMNSQLIPGMVSIIQDKLATTATVLKDHEDRILYGDGSGRLAMVSEFGVEATTYDGAEASAIYVDGCWSNTVRYPWDAIKMFKLGMPIVSATWDHDAPLDAEYVDEGVEDSDGGKWGYVVRKIVASTTAHRSYIVVTPRVSEDFEAGQAVVLLKSLNKEPVGLYGIMGGGEYDAGHPEQPMWGNRYYGDKDCQADGFEFLKATPLNHDTEFASDPTDLINLETNDGMVCTQAFDSVQDNCDEPNITCILTSREARTFYEIAWLNQRPVVNPPAMIADLGIEAPYITLGGRKVPILTSKRVCSGDWLMLPLGDLMPFIIGQQWSVGEVDGRWKHLGFMGRDVLHTDFFRYHGMVAFNRKMWRRLANLKTRASMT